MSEINLLCEMKETMSDMRQYWRMVARDDGLIYSLASLCKNNNKRVPQLANQNLVFQRATMKLNLIIVIQTTGQIKTIQYKCI